MSEDLYEKTLGETTIFKGKVVHLKELEVQLPNGRTSTREVVYHPGAVAILAEPKPGRLLFVEQFRKGPEEVLLEIPAGKLDHGEAPVDCARRELSEETGYDCGFIEKLFEFYTSPGFSDEKLTLFYAKELSAGSVHPDEDEFVNLKELSEEDIRLKLADKSIRDAKTLIAVLWWLNRKNISK